jgi:hypothetical protein
MLKAPSAKLLYCVGHPGLSTSYSTGLISWKCSVGTLSPILLHTAQLCAVPLELRPPIHLCMRCHSSLKIYKTTNAYAFDLGKVTIASRQSWRCANSRAYRGERAGSLDKRPDVPHSLHATTSACVPARRPRAAETCFCLDKRRSDAKAGHGRDGTWTGRPMQRLVMDGTGRDLDGTANCHVYLLRQQAKTWLKARCGR